MRGKALCDRTVQRDKAAVQEEAQARHAAERGVGALQHPDQPAADLLCVWNERAYQSRARVLRAAEFTCSD